mmetsp:Transcript_88952/g.181354  ORF Transcript_88952/g.181354 Transcript_88952/m.181354 type:complete len:98 (-) Transcript_88952:5-298(-)
MGRHIYVVGGSDGRTALDAVERYDTETERWEALAPLKVPRYGTAAVAVQGRIYAVGGHSGWQVLKSLEVYDPSSNMWELLPSMKIARSAATCAVCWS